MNMVHTKKLTVSLRYLLLCKFKGTYTPVGGRDPSILQYINMVKYMLVIWENIYLVFDII